MHLQSERTGAWITLFAAHWLEMGEHALPRRQARSPVWTCFGARGAREVV
jgi:hypothetical protein